MFRKIVVPAFDNCRAASPHTAEDRLPAAIDHMFEFFAHEDNRPTRLQRDLVREIEETKFKELLEKAPLPRAIAIQSASGANASAFLDASSKHHKWPMTDRAFGTIIRFRLSLPIADIMPKKCGLCDSSVDPLGHHFIECRKARDVITQHRHDGVTHAIKHACRLVDLTVTQEPEGFSEDSDDKPDLAISWDAKLILEDTATRHPCTQSMVERNKKNERGFAANAAELEKLQRHGNKFGANISAEYVPFGIESYGTYGKLAEQFVKRICARAMEESESHGRFVRKTLVTGISLAVQFGNAMALLTGVQGARAKEAFAQRVRHWRSGGG
jgi:hypothetical protein